MTLAQKLVALLGTWSRPPDVPAKAALAVAAVLALHALGQGRLLFGSVSFARPLDPEQQARADGERRRFLSGAALAAALLSVAYVSSYLNGGPRIIDATTYFLQGRAMSHGDLAWPTLEPSASFRGRFLVHHDGPDGPTLGGVFPPGYPLVLSIGFWLGAPMIVGPLLAAALVVATYRLARALAEHTAPELAEPIARAAALLSVLCAALRYHTADTMSHGAAALGITTALGCAIRLQSSGSRLQSSGSRLQAPGSRSGALALAAGLCVGWVFSTRPVSALPIAIVTAWLLRGDRRRLALAALGLVPGVALLLASQRAVTGSWLRSTQRLYYAISDGPPGCFRWGFGEGTGCVFEHGDFVHARLEHGYGVVEALGTTLRRLWPHLLDVANLEPLALLVVVAAVSAWRPRAKDTTRGNAEPLRAAVALVLLQVLAYVPFYFDGNYPGGGARFFADVLPVEHALVMIGVARLVRRPAPSSGVVRFARAAFGVLSLAAVGFAVHASYEHGKLRDRDGGRPMFEPDVLARASVTNALVFVETDHGFALGHDPRATPSTGVLVARLRDDDRDRMLFDALDRPPTWLYRLEPDAAAGGAVTAKLTPWAPPDYGKSFRFEAEAEWPPLSQEGGFAAPAWVDDCASRRRALALVPSPAGGNLGRATIELPVPSAGRWSVEVHVVHGATIPHAATRTDPGAKGTVRIGDATWSWTTDQPGPSACASAGTMEVDLVPPRALVTLEAAGGTAAVDHFSLKKIR